MSGKHSYNVGKGCLKGAKEAPVTVCMLFFIEVCQEAGRRFEKRCVVACVVMSRSAYSFSDAATHHLKGIADRNTSATQCKINSTPMLASKNPKCVIKN